MPLAGSWLRIWIYLGFAFGWSRSARPRFDTSTDMGLVLVPADAEVDSVIFRLRATDQDADFPLVFEVTATITPVVRIENLPCTLYNKVCQANVILTRRLVPGRLHDFAVRVRDSKGDTNSMQATISVTNATTPRDQIFPHIPSLIMVPENTKPGKELDYLLVRANPWSGKPVYIELWQPKELFTIRQRQTPTQTRGVITLIGELDFETQSMYTLTMYATDPYTEPGKDTRNIAGLNAVVVVQDVQDVPPIFTLAPPLTKINNSVQPGDIVLRVHAEDGDKGVPREIVYGLVSEGNPFTPFFNISETSGEIVLARPLEELTQITHVGAPVVLSVVAEEIRRSTDEPPTQATVVEVGFLLGEPGNSPPYFESDNYMVSIDENPEPGTVITFPEQYSAKVRDEDIGKAGVFALKLENNNGTFEISPAVAERVADFIITVRDNSLIDYEQYKSLTFKIIAQEVGPATNLSATVPVTIFLRDINDNSPVFDEESYEVTLSENVTAGTRVVQVHATDKDTGSFGRIQYTRIIGDGSEAFTLDPDSGAITVSMGSSLDREATPRLQLSVEARDEDGKGNRGTAPLIINLLDVNDNAPSFEKDVYEFMLTADLTNFTTQAIIKAVDADSEPPNNEVRYELVHGNYENKFYLNELTGELILRSPITKIRRKKQSVYENLGKKLRKEFVQVEDIFRDLVTNDTIKNNVTKWVEDARNRSALIHQIKEVVKNRRKRANDDPLYTLTARAYDLGVPHMSSITEIRVIRAAFMEARIVMFVVPGEHPDPTKTAETLSTITGGRVIIQEIRPYVAQNQSSTANMPAGKKSIVLARVEQNGPDTPLVDIEKIRETLAANGVGIIGTTETVTDIINTPKSTNSNGSNTNSSVKAVVEDEAIIYKAENKLLFWLLLILGLLMLAAIITLILCCICPSCPFYMAPRKRRVHSSEVLISKPNGRPKRHIRRTHATAIDGSLTEKKQAWSADPTRRNWQFNRRNTRTLGLASLPGDVAYVSGQQDDMNVHTLRLRDGPMIEREKRDAAYAEDIEAQRHRSYELADADSLQRHELERGSDAHRHSYRYADADDDDEKLVREQHFFREGNAEVLRLVTRGPGEDSQHHRATLVVDGKEILLRRFIEDQELRHDIAMQDIEAARSMESHKRSKEAIPQQQGIILLPERLEMGHGQHVEKLDGDVPRLMLDQRDYDEKIEQKESQMRQEQLRQEAQLRQEPVIPGLVVGGVSGTLDPVALGVKDQTKSYSHHDMELARQNALLTRLLLERESKAVGVAMDSTSYLETQSLPGQVAIATQTDRNAGTQTERHVRSRSDNDESEDESRQKKKLKSKKRHVEVDSKRRTLWMKSPIEEEDSPGFDKRLSVLRKKVKEAKDSRKGSLEPDVLREISDSLDGAEDTEPTKKVYRRSTEETNIRYKMLGEDESASSAELSKKKSSRMISDKSRSTDDRRRDVTESTSSPEVKAKVKRSIRAKVDHKSPKKEDKRSTQKKADPSTEPSFRILEKEITLLTKKLSKLGEKKAQESTGSESTVQDKTRSVKKDSKKNAEQMTSKKMEESAARRVKGSTEPSTSKSSVPEEASTHRKETFLSKARQKLKYQQAAAASTASSELEDGSDKSKKLISGTVQEPAKQKQSVAPGRLKRQAHVEKESKKSSTASEDVEKQKTSSSKEMSNEDQKKDKPTKLVSRVKHLASIGRKEHVSEDFGTSTSSGKGESKKSVAARREAEKKTSTDTSENTSDNTAQRKIKKVSEKSVLKSEDPSSGIKRVETAVKTEREDEKDVGKKKESTKKSPTSVFDGVKEVLNGAVSKSVMSVNEVLQNVLPVKEKGEDVPETDLKMPEAKPEPVVEKPTDEITTIEQKESISEYSEKEGEKQEEKELEKKEEVEAKDLELPAEDDKKDKSELMTPKTQTAEPDDSKPEGKEGKDIPEEDIKPTSEEQLSPLQLTSAEILSPAKKVDEVMHKLIDEITQEQPEKVPTDVPIVEQKTEVPLEPSEQIKEDKMDLKELKTEGEKPEESVKDDKIATEVKEDLKKEEPDLSKQPETQEISSLPKESENGKDVKDQDKVGVTLTQDKDQLKDSADTTMEAGPSTSPKPSAPEEERKSPKSPTEKISAMMETKHELGPEATDKVLPSTEQVPDETEIKTEDKQASEEATKDIKTEDKQTSEEATTDLKTEDKQTSEEATKDKQAPEEPTKDVEEKDDKDEEHKQESDSKVPEVSKEEDATKDKHADASEKEKESEEVKIEDKEESVGADVPIQPAMQYLDVSTPIFTSAIDTLGDSDDSDTSSDISRKTTLTAGPYRTPRHRPRKSPHAEYIQNGKKFDASDVDEHLALEVPAKETPGAKIKSGEPVRKVAEDEIDEGGSADRSVESDRKAETPWLSGKVSPRVTKKSAIRPEIEAPRISKAKEDQSGGKVSEVKGKAAFRSKEDQRFPKASEGKDKPTTGLKEDQRALIRVIDSRVPEITAHKHGQEDKPKKRKHPQEKLRISPTRKEKRSPSEETSRERAASGQKAETIHHPGRAQKATEAEETGRKDAEQGKQSKKKDEARQKQPRSKTEKDKRSLEKPGVEIDVSKTRSKYMAWYKQKREEMERKRQEMKEDEEQLPRWLRRSLGYRKSARDQDAKKKPDSKSPEMTPRTRRKVKPLVNVESEQLKAIVRQGRKLRKAEGGGNEDPPVQIFATTPPAAPPPEQKHHLLQHSEYKFERMPPPFYLHPPPPAPHPSPQLSPVHDDPRLHEYRRPEEDFDSGIVMPLPAGTRLRHQQLLEKKSVFDIAYSEAAPSQLRSDSATPPS